MKKIYAVFACPVKGGWKREALKFRVEGSFNKERSLCIIEFKNKFVFVLTEAGDEGEIYQLVELLAELTKEVIVVVQSFGFSLAPSRPWQMYILFF